MRVGIIGLGLMGGSLALALRDRRPDVEVLGRDEDQAVWRQAVNRGMVVAGDPLEADLVVLATPIPALPEVLAGLSGYGGVVTDTASTKVRVMGWATAAGVDLVGGHPMCGRERSGLGAADATLFDGAPWVLTRDESTLTELVRAVGAIPVFMDAERHDRLVAAVSHAAFLLSAGYVQALSADSDWEGMKQVAGSGFRDMSRLAAGEPELYQAIVTTNREPILRSLTAIEESLARIRRHVEQADARLVELLEEAKLARDRWARDAGQG